MSRAHNTCLNITIECYAKDLSVEFVQGRTRLSLNKVSLGNKYYLIGIIAVAVKKAPE